MRLRVRIRATWRHVTRARDRVQLLRLTPRDGPGQKILSWSLEADCGRRLPSYVDGFGNLTHLHTLQGGCDAFTLSVEGLVETRDTSGVLGALAEPLPPAVFLRSTPLTAPEPCRDALAAELASEPDALTRLHRLLEGVRPTDDATSREPSGISAPLAGAGVCHDAVHAFVATARCLGQPTRYVSGFVHDSDEDAAVFASHGWAEARLPDLGWIGFDPARGVTPNARYVRTAIGIDWADAAPVRAAPRGAPEHDRSIRVRIEEIAVQ